MASDPFTEPNEETAAEPQSMGSPDEPVEETPAAPAQDAAADPSAEAEVPTEEPASEAESKTHRKIQIGSRRGDSGQGIQSSKPVTAAPTTPPSVPPGILPETVSGADVESMLDPPSAGPVPTPSRRDPITPDLQKEIDAAFAETAIDELMSGADESSGATQELELDTRRKASVVRIHGDNVFFGLSARNEGFASLRQFREPPSVGDEMDIVIKAYNPDDGLYEVGIPGSSVSVADWSDLTEGAIVEARITGANTGGLECMVNTIRGFIPSSQIAMFRVQDFAEFIGQKLPCAVTEVNQRRKNLVLSHRAVLEREREEARKQLIEELKPGETREGVVRSLRDFGAFVDLGGIDGLIHISQLSWDRVGHPSEVLSEGQKVRVKIEKVNAQTGKIGLSYRELLEHPWTDVETKFPVGATVKGAVTRIAKFGAFVRLASGVEGLIHISEMAHQRIGRVADVVNEGDEVEVKVLSVDQEAQRIGLSLKATLPEPEKQVVVEPDEPPRQPSASKKSGPLKGGVDRPSGGEQFGLKW